MPAQPRPFRRIKAKLQALAAARLLKAGGLIGHGTSTIPGVAAHPESARGMQRLQQFKQRKGPFLLLAASTSHALRLARFVSPLLRKTAHEVWPGPVTLIFPARTGIASPCCQRGYVAVRVDADEFSSKLTELCGGYVLSSSLNRQGKETMPPCRQLRMRMHRHLQKCISGKGAGNKASKMYHMSHRGMKRIR